MNSTRRAAPQLLLALAASGLLFLLCGCAGAPYGASEPGNPSGYFHRQIDESTCMVVFRGTPSQPPEQVRDFALLRAAELSLELGFPAFVVLSESSKETLLPTFSPRMSVPAPGPNRARFGQAFKDPPRVKGGAKITYPGKMTTLTIRFVVKLPGEPGTHDAFALRRKLRAKHSLRR